VNSLH